MPNASVTETTTGTKCPHVQAFPKYRAPLTDLFAGIAAGFGAR
jgi:hypothetical protein